VSAIIGPRPVPGSARRPTLGSPGNACESLWKSCFRTARPIRTIGSLIGAANGSFSICPARTTSYLLADRIKIDRRLITDLDLEQSVGAEPKRVGGGQSGIDARNELRRIGRRQRLVAGSDVLSVDFTIFWRWRTQIAWSPTAMACNQMPVCSGYRIASASFSHSAAISR
jgi:hypothetical protein